MCTTFKYKNCMGRNLDYEVSYDEELRLIKSMELYNEYAIIGMCTGFIKEYPLMYEGMNEKGLCCSALAFTGNAVYGDEEENKINIPAFDFVFQILSSFCSVEEVKDFLYANDVNIDNRQYSDEFPNSDLHWFVCDKKRGMIIEQTKEGLNYYWGEVMTNNPPFVDQLKLEDTTQKYMGLYMYSDVPKKYYTRGFETYGLLGDYTSYSRFSKVKYFKEHLERYSKDNFNNVTQTFHLLSSVEQIYGLTPVNDKFEYTIYSVVYDMENLEVYLRFYDDLNYEIRRFSDE